MNSQFLEAVFTDSIQHPNFFNGRILTATDLRDEQAAELKRSRYLGQAIGTGVVYGLTVAPDSTQQALVITSGLAINPRGDGLALPQDTTVQLVLTEPLGNPTSPFVPCDIAGATTLTGKVSAGYYLLAITSATRLSVTMAPNSGLAGDRVGCTNRYEEIGVQFKLIPLTDQDIPGSLTTNDSRSRLAHLCFGTNELAEVMAQPTKSLVGYGLVDNLRSEKTQRLTDCDVPLAVFRFQPPTLQFVDLWAVRRPPIPAMYPNTDADQAFIQFVSPRRVVEAATFLLQFQAHLEDLRNSSSLTPANVIAKDYFEYLPAAGYLPVQPASIANIASDRNFRVATFFGATIPEQTIAPVLLRSLFHESFYAEPIHPGMDAVDIYRVQGADAYRIFVRRIPVILQQPEPPQPEPPPNTTATGNLTVTVFRDEGTASNIIQEVQATQQTTGRIYTGQRSQGSPNSLLKIRQYEQFVQEQKIKVLDKYAGLLINPRTNTVKPTKDFGIVAEKSFYQFNDLPAGTYTVKAIPTSKNYVGISTQVTVKANIDNFVAVTIRLQSLRPPSDFFVSKDKLTPKGMILDGFVVNPQWLDDYPDWERDTLGPNPVINPSSDQWVRFDDRELQVGLEDVLSLNPKDNPGLATDGAVIYLRKDYDPGQVTDTIAAFVQTPDGSRFPAIPLAADNALDKPASVDRTAIPDFDRATVDRLQNAGLGGIDAIASAPAKLVAAVLGQSTEYSQSLIGEARTSLQDDFRNGYLGYAGITKTQSDALKGVFSKGKVDLANATPAAVATVLGTVSSSGFANRFLSDVRSTVPQQSYSLNSTGIGATGQAALAGIGVVSNQDLFRRSESSDGRTQLKEALGVTDATLNRYVETATLNFARGELATAPEKSIGTLAGVPADVKTSLVAAGIGSAKELANANPAELAAVLGVSTAETTAIVNAAAPFGSKAYLTLVTGATKGAVSAETVTNAGLTSAGAIAQADTNRLTAAGIDVNSVQLVKRLSNQLLSGSGFRRFS